MPTLVPGTRLKSVTVRGLMKATNDAAALNCRTTLGRVPARLSAIDSATNNRPIRVAADVAMTTKRSR